MTHAYPITPPGFVQGDGRNGIGWCDETVNPIRGCTAVSAGCANCYAEATAARLAKIPNTAATYSPLVVEKSTGWTWSGKVAFDIGQMDRIKRLKTPSRVFVGSMTDIFQDAVPDEWLDRVWDMIEACPQHLFYVLTKRPERMARYSQDRQFGRNVWAGVSVEDQATANERLPWLCSLVGVHRNWISYEPALGPVDLYRALNPPRTGMGSGLHLHPRDWIHFVVAGGESGAKARPAHPDWFYSMRDYCGRHRIAFRFKQWGEWRPPMPAERFNTSHGRAGHPPAFIVGTDGTPNCFHHPGIIRPTPMIRVGVRAAGRKLDGVEHLALPEWPTTCPSEV